MAGNRAPQGGINLEKQTQTLTQKYNELQTNLENTLKIVKKLQLDEKIKNPKVDAQQLIFSSLFNAYIKLCEGVKVHCNDENLNRKFIEVIHSNISYLLLLIEDKDIVKSLGDSYLDTNAKLEEAIKGLAIYLDKKNDPQNDEDNVNKYLVNDDEWNNLSHTYDKENKEIDKRYKPDGGNNNQESNIITNLNEIEDEKLLTDSNVTVENDNEEKFEKINQDEYTLEEEHIYDEEEELDFIKQEQNESDQEEEQIEKGWFDAISSVNLFGRFYNSFSTAEKSDYAEDEKKLLQIMSDLEAYFQRLNTTSRVALVNEINNEIKKELDIENERKRIEERRQKLYEEHLPIIQMEEEEELKERLKNSQVIFDDPNLYQEIYEFEMIAPKSESKEQKELKNQTESKQENNPRKKSGWRIFNFWKKEPPTPQEVPKPQVENKAPVENNSLVIVSANTTSTTSTTTTTEQNVDKTNSSITENTNATSSSTTENTNGISIVTQPIPEKKMKKKTVLLSNSLLTSSADDKKKDQINSLKGESSSKSNNVARPFRTKSL